jgi:hypothetical protein
VFRQSERIYTGTPQNIQGETVTGHAFSTGKTAGTATGGKAGRLEDWKIGRLEGWKTGRLEGWKTGRLEGWKTGRLKMRRWFVVRGLRASRPNSIIVRRLQNIRFVLVKGSGFGVQGAFPA